MKNIQILTSIIIFWNFFSCSSESDRLWTTIKNESDYELIERYIVRNPETKYLREAIALIFKLRKMKNDSTIMHEGHNYYGRNITRIIVGENNRIAILSETLNGKQNIKTISKYISDYLLNYNDNMYLPEKAYRKCKNVNLFISKGHFRLYVHSQAEINIVKKIIVHLSEHLQKYKKHISLVYFKTDYENLDNFAKKFLDMHIDTKLSIFQYRTVASL